MLEHLLSVGLRLGAAGSCWNLSSAPACVQDIKQSFTWKIFLLFQKRQEVPSVSWKRFRLSDWSQPPLPHSSPVPNRGGRVELAHTLVSHSALLCSARPFIHSLFYRVFGAGSHLQRHKAGIKNSALLQNHKIFFRAVLNAQSCSHGNVALWLCVQWPSGAAKFSKTTVKTDFEVFLQRIRGATVAIELIVSTGFGVITRKNWRTQSMLVIILYSTPTLNSVGKLYLTLPLWQLFLFLLCNLKH